MHHLVSLMTFVPLVAAVVVLLGPSDPRAQRGIAMAGALVALAISVVILVRYQWVAPTQQPLDPFLPWIQEKESMPWIPRLGITYTVGIDGINLFLVLLTTVLTPIVIWASASSVKTRVREFHLFLLLLETAMLGAFVALDAVLFYVFWELMLVPMYFIIGIWGGPRRVYAAVKFFLFTAVGSLLMLVAILYVYFAHQQGGAAPSALLSDLLQTHLTHQAQLWLFAAFALAFAIKVPMLPFHTWLPDAHVEAPTGGSVILAGVLLKMGTYGFLRWAMPLFPEAAFAFRPLILALAAIGVVYGALVALVQPDMKRMIAYSSVSHLGFVMLGLFAVDRATGWTREAVTGAVLQMVNHGLSTGALFLLVGVIYERRHTREIAQFGGLAQRMPMYAAILLFVTLSSIGLPGLNGFVGEFLILIGTWKVAPVAAGVAASGVVLGAVYMLWLYQRVALGRITRPENEHVPDATRAEVAYLAPVLAAILFIGLYPQPLLTRILPAVDSTLTHMENGAGIGSGAPETARLEVPR